MRIFKFGLLAALFSLLVACAHKTPVTDGDQVAFCDFKRYQLNLDHRNNPSLASSNVESLGQVLTDGFSPGSASPIPKGDMLFLSGGSLNGAFGAGVLKGWSEKDGQLPDFSVVTGVSTGAILSLAAFTNIPEAAIDGYDVESEAQAINAFVRRDKNGKLSDLSYLTALRKGALADIAPLKDTIYNIAAEHGVLHAIAKRGIDGRLLLTGVVDVDTGEAVALDMTAMAIKIYNLDKEFQFEKNETISELKRRAPKVGHYVDCFTSAIAASSSVPLAALPIAIDNRLYIDGGARFLIFSDVVGPIINPDVKFNVTGANKPIDLYMLINGDQTITAKCKKKVCPDDLTGYDYWDVKGGRDDWNVLELVERTVDVLKTQVGEFSESEIRFRALEQFLAGEGIDIYELILGDEANGIKSSHNFTTAQQMFIDNTVNNSSENYNLKMLKIEPETLMHMYEHMNMRKTCAQWREYDEITDRNLQFHVNYMRCMIEAGKAVIKEEGWK